MPDGGLRQKLTFARLVRLKVGMNQPLPDRLNAASLPGRLTINRTLEMG
jgi:hypothetical protein